MSEVEMAITLYGRSSSNNVQKVLWALGEVQQPFDHLQMGGSFKGLDSPEFLAMNPNGTVPVLRDGALVLWESNAIVRYLAAQYGDGGLFPPAAAERALCDQWTDWCATTFQPKWMSVFWQVVRTPKVQQDAAAIDAAIARTEGCLAIMDMQLGRTAYLGGSVLTYADIVAGDAMYRWSTMPIQRQSHPNVARWHDLLKQRRAFRAGIEIDYAELVGRLAF